MKYLAIFVISLFSFNALAFDNERQGFILGLGIGIANLDYEIDNLSDSETGMATTLKIGYGFDSQLTAYFLRSSSLTESEGVDFSEGITGIGMSYYLQPETESLYFNLGVGEGHLSGLDRDFDKDQYGSAFSFGLGYEAARHHSLEMNVINIDLDDTDYESTAFHFTYNYIFY